MRLYNDREIARRRAMIRTRTRAYQNRSRDEYGRYTRESDELRSVKLTIRLTPGEMDSIAEAAASRDATVTSLIVAAVNVYGHGPDRAARTFDRRGLGL
mgnify:CR=1 FL=1